MPLKTMFPKILTLTFLLVVLAGCGATPPAVPVEQVAGRFYEAIKNRDFPTAASYYADTIPREDRVQELQEIQAAMGDLQTYELKEKLTNTVYSGIRYIYKYRLQYTGGVLTETLVMFENVSGDPIRIEARNYRLKGQAPHTD